MIFPTTLSLVAMAGALTTSALVPANVSWQPSYKDALSQVALVQKPIAVFIGHGPAGYAQLVTSGMGSDAVKQLQQSYICLYVDADTKEGQELAKAFRLTEGVVISDRRGTHQALRHEGRLNSAVLLGYLTRFSTVQIATTTEEYSANAPAPQATIAPASYYQPVQMGTCANGRCGTPGIIPAMVTAPFQFVTGNCPGGNCRR